MKQRNAAAKEISQAKAIIAGAYRAKGNMELTERKLKR